MVVVCVKTLVMTQNECALGYLCTEAIENLRNQLKGPQAKSQSAR